APATGAATIEKISTNAVAKAPVVGRYPLMFAPSEGDGRVFVSFAPRVPPTRILNSEPQMS
ncbi:MAG: hypothetical protein V2I67_18980, partial [Thermoanaerobaculales bacterium]|nr:hypothetical protein [Thermoanaerobaculales bacterium]